MKTYQELYRIILLILYYLPEFKRRIFFQAVLIQEAFWDLADKFPDELSGLNFEIVVEKPFSKELDKIIKDIYSNSTFLSIEQIGRYQINRQNFDPNRVIVDLSQDKIKRMAKAIHL